MVKDDEDNSYEIVPYKEIVELKKQIAELQIRTGDTSSKDLLNSIATLTKSINNLLGLFSSAAEQMKLEEKTEAELSEKVAPLFEKIKGLEKQNETIAEGIVAVAEMIKEIKKPKEKEEPSFFEAEEQSDIKQQSPPQFRAQKPFEVPPPPSSFLHSGTPRVVLRRPPIPQQTTPPPWQTSSPIPPPFQSRAQFPERPSSQTQALPPLPPLPPLPAFEEKPKKGFFGMSRNR